MAPSRLDTAVLDLLTIDDVAEWMGVKPGTVRSWVFYRRIPYVKVGALVRFDRAELVCWLEEQRHPAIDASTLAERRVG